LWKEVAHVEPGRSGSEAPKAFAERSDSRYS
jgi:hypothetical protein